jgi:hypothetical protein
MVADSVELNYAGENSSEVIIIVDTKSKATRAVSRVSQRAA